MVWKGSAGHGRRTDKVRRGTRGWPGRVRRAGAGNVEITEARLKPLWRFMLGAQWMLGGWRGFATGLDHCRKRIDCARAGWPRNLRCMRCRLRARPRPQRSTSGVSWYLAAGDLPHGSRHRQLSGHRNTCRRGGCKVRPDRHSPFGVDLPDTASSNSTDAPSSASLSRGESNTGVCAAHESSISDQVVRFREKYALGDRPLLLSVGRISARKGLREFVVQALPRIVAASPEALLLIVGDAPRDALRAQTQTPASIRAAAEASGVSGNIRFLGRLSETELLAAYRSANVHVFPVRKIPDDPEGFGMVAVEAAAHGLATVAFATGGVVDAVAEGTSGYLAASGDYVAFAAAVVQALAQKEAMRRSCFSFAQRFAWSGFGVQIAAQLPGMNVATESNFTPP